MVNGSSITWDNADGAVLVRSISSQPGSPDVVYPQVTDQRFPPPVGFERNELFLAQMRHFLEVIAGKAAPRCTLQDGIQALELALSVQRSQQEKRLIR